MIKKYTYNKLTWIDMVFPTIEEVKEIMDEYGVNQVVGKDILTPSPRPKVELYSNLIYLILHFPAFKHSHNEAVQEIDFVIGDNFLITTRYDSIDAVERFAKVMEVNSVLGKHNMGNHAGFLFYHLIKEIYKAMGDELHYIEDKIREIEKKIFKGNERAMVYEISDLNRTLLNFRISTNMHKEVLKSFDVAARSFFGNDFSYHLRGILEEYFKVENMLKGCSQLLLQLRETNDSLLSTRQNETMKTLTIITFLSLPFSVITGFFQMTTKGTPLIGTRYDWSLIMIIMIVVTIGFYYIARRNSWF